MPGIQTDGRVWAIEQKGVRGLGYLDETQMAKRIERRIANGQRRSRALSIVLCAALLILGIAVIVAIVARWFIVL
jgi:hypothetical protein